MITFKSEKDVEILRQGRGIMTAFFEAFDTSIEVGATTLELDRMVEKECKKLGVKPAFKGYMGFPFSICASPNDVVVHGFPNDNPLKEGDVVSIDFGIVIDGLYLDSAYTFPVGTVSSDVATLLSVTRESCLAGLNAATKGSYVRDISRAVEAAIQPHGYGIVREFVGHGVGRDLHEDPQIPNFDNGTPGARLEVGMTLAVEPMVNLGSPDVYVAKDGWSVCTKDGKPSVHFEHTVLVGEDGPEILTEWSDRIVKTL